MKLTIMNKVKHFLKKPAPPVNKSDLWLKKFNVKTFIDIGAYVGEYIDYACRMFPEAKIYAFEPLDECVNVLKKKSKNNPDISVFNFALGDTNSPGNIYRSSYAPSSSILPMAGLHKLKFPESSKLKLQPIQIRKLDTVFKSVFLDKDIFIKIDTQGYEDKVIQGGKKIFSQATIIQIEVSFEKLYKGQPLFNDIYIQLVKLGFVFHGFRNQILSPDDGSILQAHSYFLKIRK